MSQKDLTFADKQRIYDENLAREKRFASLYAAQEKPEYFLNPFRGRRNQAVADPIGGSRGTKFLNRDDAFLKSLETSTIFSANRARSASPSQNQTPLPTMGANFRESNNNTPSEALATNTSSVLNFNQHPQVSPTPTTTNKSSALYDTKSSFGRSLLRMQRSNAVLKPKVELHGLAVKFDADLKSAIRPPQLRYGYPRTEAHSYGWYSQPLNPVDKQPVGEITAAEYEDIIAESAMFSAGTRSNNNGGAISPAPTNVSASSTAARSHSSVRTRMSAGGYFLAKGLKTAQWE